MASPSFYTNKQTNKRTQSFFLSKNHFSSFQIYVFHIALLFISLCMDFFGRRRQKLSRAWGQFHQHSTSSFYKRRSQKHKKDSQVKQLYCAFGICAHKSCLQNAGEIDPLSAKLFGNCVSSIAAHSSLNVRSQTQTNDFSFFSFTSLKAFVKTKEMEIKIGKKV